MKSITIFILILLSSHLFAQFNYGPKIGIAGYTVSINNEFMLTPGAQVGLVITLKKGLFVFRPEILVSSRKSQIHSRFLNSGNDLATNGHIEALYTELHLNIGFIVEAGDNEFQFFLGPSVAYGNNTTVVRTQGFFAYVDLPDIYYTDYTNEFSDYTIEAGMQIGISFLVNDKWLYTLHHSRDLIGIPDPTPNWNIPVSYWRSITLSAAILF